MEKVCVTFAYQYQLCRWLGNIDIKQKHNSSDIELNIQASNRAPKTDCEILEMSTKDPNIYQFNYKYALFQIFITMCLSLWNQLLGY